MQKVLLCQNVGGVPTPVDFATGLKVVAAGTTVTEGTEDAAAAGNPTGPVLIARRRDTLTAAEVSADGDLIALNATSRGELRVSPQGDLAHDAVDGGNPIKIGGRAASSLSALTPVAAADRADAMFDLDGALLVRVGPPMGDWKRERISNSDGNETACIGDFAAPGAGKRLVLTGMYAVNDSTSNIYVDLKDGAGGTILISFSLPAKGGNNGPLPLPTPIKLTANTALYFDTSAPAQVYLTFVGYVTAL